MPPYLRGDVASSLPRAAIRRAPGITSRKQPWTCDHCRSIVNTTARPVIRSRTQPISSFRRYNSSNASLSSAEQGKAASVSTSTALPSHSEKQRWNISKRWTTVMDNMLARASVAGQHINVYTGTDYSGIEALRKEIMAREKDVRDQHTAVAEAKEAHIQSRRKQAASQKEIVGLLERKSSWSPTDLERYMSLVRSEHVDDQAVQQAAEQLAAIERHLESSRSLLEKLERQQYHEEQIWSDTIRRNSTWVTIGLMGINIVLLLAQISVFEPYRRRKIVDEIEQALDQRGLSDIPRPQDLAAASTSALTAADQSSKMADKHAAAELDVAPLQAATEDISAALPLHALEDGLWARMQSLVRDLLSPRPIEMRQSDRTALVLESAVAGASVALLCTLSVLRRG